MPRYALYYTPPPGPLADFGAVWLGWDPVSGMAPAPVTVPGLPAPREALTDRPRKYGFHATLKAPFHLAPGQTEAALHDALAAFCAATPPARCAGLRVAPLGRFLALVPDGDAGALSDLAASVVTELDPFRAPLTDADRARRGAESMAPDLRSLFERWGYPYVMQAFRFHMTLTGLMARDAVPVAEAALRAHIDPLLPRPFVLDAVTLCVEGSDGRFRCVTRIPLAR